MIASSIMAAPSPQRRINLLHRNRSILTDSSDEAKAYSAPPKRFLSSTSRRRRCSIPHPHGAATLKPAPRATSPRRLSSSARPLRWRRPYQPDLLLLLLWLLLDHSPSCCCSGSRSLTRAAAAPALARDAAAAPALARSLALLLLLRLSLDRSLAQLLLLRLSLVCSRCSCCSPPRSCCCSAPI